jgi:PncC family amidohydrolase
VTARHRREGAAAMTPRRVPANLRGAGVTVAVAESCTGGLVAAALTSVPGASAVFVGGVVAYADRVKAKAAGVPSATIRRHGAVSKATAAAMARGIRKAFGADVGLAVTGIAGPGGGVPGKPVGTVWFAVAAGGRVRALRRRFTGSRAAIRRLAVRQALALLAEAAQHQRLSEFSPPRANSKPPRRPSRPHGT